MTDIRLQLGMNCKINWIFILGCALYLLVGSAHVFWGVISPQVLFYLDESASALSTLIFLQFSGFLCGVLFAPKILAIFGFYWHVIISLILTLVGFGLVISSSNISTLASVSGLIGIGCGSIETSVATLILYETGSARKFATLEACFALAALMFPIFIFATESIMGWQHQVLIVLFATLLLAIFWGTIFWSRRSTMVVAHQYVVQAAIHPSKKIGSKGQPGLVLGVSTFAFLYAGIETNAANFLPQLIGLYEGGGTAIIAVSLFWLGIICGRIFASIAGERLIQPKALFLMAACFGFGALGLAFFGLTDLVSSIAWIILMGLGAGGIFPTALSLATRSILWPTEYITGLFIASASLGGALLSLPVGFLSQHYGGSIGAIWFAACGLLLCIFSFLLKKTLPNSNSIKAKN